MRVFNFAAGPATLPLEVLEQAQSELTDWRGSGMSVMEVSHRSKAFKGVAADLEASLRELLAIPSGYKVILLQGGATAQFAGIPLNLAAADVHRRLPQHRRLVEEGASARPSATARSMSRRTKPHPAYNTVPAPGSLKLTAGAAYVHYTPNETIGGVEFGYVPQVGAVPLVADFSSTFLSRPIDVSRFGLIYAGAQKNVGPAGLCIVIVREELHRQGAPRYATGPGLQGHGR